MLQKLKNIFWHPALTFFFALKNGFPGHGMTVIGVTGTKGKSSVSEMLYEIFKAAGYKTALASGIHFAYPGADEPNLFKMTMPGRGFLQRFLGKAQRAGTQAAIVEITSEGAVQSRHRFIALDGLVVTNIQKEHIEAHGSFENYVAAKRKIVHALGTSSKKKRVLVVNEDDPVAKTFLDVGVPTKLTFRGAETPGDFHNANMRAAVTVAEAFGISKEVAEQAVASMPQIRGRVEPVECGQDFKAIVDYAHTPDSLIALYQRFPNTKRICVLGNTGGGRDTWKRPLMGEIADGYCDTVILTNEDPYDEDPEKIVREMVTGMKKEPLIIMDRRTAIGKALSLAKSGDTVLISGKGTDPYIMEANGKKLPWDDARIVREELEKLGAREE
jgi:UDP-N-acetylmuramoyl-L-alanyl-D-glutamate--2,6-diaminopimelate ligase